MGEGPKSAALAAPLQVNRRVWPDRRSDRGCKVAAADVTKFLPSNAVFSARVRAGAIAEQCEWPVDERERAPACARRTANRATGSAV